MSEATDNEKGKQTTITTITTKIYENTTEEIRKLLNFCDERLKVVVLLLASTGLRLGATLI
jgi:integrase